MSLKNYFIILGIFLLIDGLWLFVISRNFYNNEIGTLLLSKPNLIPAIIFYLLFAFAILFFVIVPGLEKKSLIYIFKASLILGIVSYATYDLTNLATLNGWSLKITIIDILWGGLLTTATSVVSYFLIKK